MHNCTPKHPHAMTITKYRPASSPFNGMMNEFFGRDIGHVLGSDDARRTMPAVNILERGHEFELSLNVPGYSKEELKLDVKDDVLTISADRKMEESKERERYTRREFMQSSFTRSFRLPEAINADGIQAEYRNGVLHVRIPKAEVAKPKQRSISIG